MIFVTVGSSFQPFTRLLNATDEMAPRLGIPLVVVPRQKQFGESFNDHQLHFSELIWRTSQMQEFVLDICDLGPALERALERRRRGQTYEPHLLRDRLIATIAAFVENIARD